MEDQHSHDGRPRVTVFAPNLALSVTLEREGTERERVHFHPAGQGVWVARMVAEVGALPVLCGLNGGESGALLEPLLAGLHADRHLVPALSPSACYVTDRREGERVVLSCALADPPSRHELDELFSLTCVEALAGGWLVLTNPLPAEALPLELYGDLLRDVRGAGCRTLVDLSSPRLDSALEGEPDLVKVNDWELAEFVRGPVSAPAQLRAAAERLLELGAKAAVVTRGEQPALVVTGTDAWWLTPPLLTSGFREGCGDAMLGALAGSWARGESFEEALRMGAAAGAANYLRRGLAGSSREVIEGLLGAVALERA